MKTRYLILLYALVLYAGHTYAQSPVEFIKNEGQWASWFKYKAQVQGQGGEIFLENDGLRYLLCDPANAYKMDSFHHGQITKKPTMKFHVYKMTFEGASQQPEMQGQRPEPSYYNYFIGNDPTHWKSGIHPYQGLNYNNLYKGINMQLSSEGSSLVYEFFVQPGADASQILLKFEGAEKMSINDDNLIINTSVGKVMEVKPNAYQYINDNKVPVACNYHLKNNKVSFDFPDGYDHTQQLIIDPTIVFCSFTGSSADNWGFTATYDNAGNFYMGGLVNALSVGAGGMGGSYPVTPGAYQSTFAGGEGNNAFEYGADIGIMKLAPDGKTRIYATYLGGTGNERPHSMIVDGAGNLIVAGRTHSIDFPVTTGAFQTTNHGGWDIIVSKFNPTATALIGSTYMGGSADDGVNFDSTEVGYGQLKYNYGDDARSEVQIDNSGNIYVAGCTESTDFPTKSAIATTLSGLQDGVVFKLNSTLTSMQWGTYLSGIGYDAGYVLAFNTSQTSVYVGGGTNSSNFPVTTGSWQPTFGGGLADGYILKFQNSPPYNIQKGTFIGTSNYDQVYGLQVDMDDNVYAMGQSLGGTFPVTGGVYTNPASSQFIIKMDSNLSKDLISTIYGSGDPAHTNISPVAFLVDTCQNVYVSGWGGDLASSIGSKTVPPSIGTTTGMPLTSDAYQSTTDGFDFYFIVLGPGMTSLRYATFYGRNAPGQFGEHVDGGTSRFDKHGIIYQAICANCGGTAIGVPPFPTTTGAWSTVDGCSGNCNEAGLKIAFNIGPVSAIVSAGPSTSGCAPLVVNFTNGSNNALSYVWNFGDGTTTTAFSPSHTFTGSGTYTVTLSAANSNACFKTNDTAYLYIHVDTNIISPSFTYILKDSCNPYTASYTNTSIDKAGGTPTYQWYLGDGTSFSGVTPPDHNYPDTGNYMVTLVMSDALACKSPDTVIQKLSIHNFRVSASFVAPDTLCAGTAFTPSIKVSNGGTSLWTFGDGHSSNGADPSYTYDSTGTYTLKFVEKNSAACNGADSFTKTITVVTGPIANFSFDPVPPVPNTPVSYTNESIRATRYLWNFGDDTTSTDTNPVHQFDRSGTYKTCLNAYNETTCPSVICKQVPTEVDPLIGLPTAFSPNGDGSNDILYVRGAAIKTLDLKIFNRWGQLVFETTSKERGWDGTFNGQPQPIEAYAYVLNATFIDGSAKVLKGNITLLR